MPSSPTLDAQVVTLRDGSQVVLRPLAGADRRALSAAFERLGEASRYKRFLCAMPRLSESQLHHLVEADQRDHVALAAVHGTEIVAVARFFRLDRREAEPAIAVVDDFQGRGLGGALFTALADRALERGVTRYRALVLAHNLPMLRLLAALGELQCSHAGEALDVTVRLRGEERHRA